MAGEFWVVLTGIAFAVSSACGQVVMTGGAYFQNFNSLTNSGNPNWTNNLTLPGWYAAKVTAPTELTGYTIGTGSSGTGAFYSFGSSGSGDRALGSVSSGTPGAFAYGICFTNNTGSAQTNFTIAYTGEQWRDANGTGAVTNVLAFSYRIDNSPITNADTANSQLWTSVNALDFSSPVVNAGSVGTALDGNVATNRQGFTNIVLAGVVVQPGEEIFFRWRDANDSGSDAGIALDDLAITFQSTSNAPPSSSAPVITAQPQSQATGENGLAMFSVSAAGNPAPSFQWKFKGTNLPAATNATLFLGGVTTNQAGDYFVTMTNTAGATNSDVVALRVTAVSHLATNGEIRYLTYNVNGNGVTDWSTNAAQVQAVGRQLLYLNPDIVTFNEIPYTNTFEMANWVKAYLPGFFLATNSATDGSIRSVVASRFPITRSQSWLANSSLVPFGYSGTFPRDLFEAQVAVSNYPVPLHVFVTHLKAFGTQDDGDRRGAQALAISNFFVNTFLPGTNGSHLYILSGDLNEDVFFPETNYVSSHPIQRLTASSTGLFLTTPVNPFRGAPTNSYTESIRNPLDTRFDYIMPCAALFTNLSASEVFRTDLLPNFPPNLFSNDDRTASDHLPVLMVFRNPFDTPFRLLSATVTNQTVQLQWEAQNNRNYSVEMSSNLTSWAPLAINLFTTTTNATCTFSTNFAGGMRYFRIYLVP